MLGKFIKMCLLMICMCCTAYGYEMYDSHAYMENGKEEQLNKCYLSHKHVEISNTQILYVTKDIVTPITQLFSDEYGIYTIVEEPHMTMGLWTCYKDGCNTLNSNLSTKCRKCGF